ncbi:MAG: ATP phosphoribosyltransferase [Dehalococcoidia bacterium]|jgi:ATP phosphoribosyltransferase
MIRLALPTGDLREPVGALLSAAGFDVRQYTGVSRSYILGPESNGGIQMRVFREKDIPIQIALGNYDFGICRLEWVEDLAQRFPTNAIVPLRDLDVGRRALFVAAAAGRNGDVRDWAAVSGLRIVSEYANIAEAFAMGLRLSSYRVFPVWGAAEVYPPEDADLALISANDAGEVRRRGLAPLHELLDSSVWLIANRRNLAEKDLRAVLDSPLAAGSNGDGTPSLLLPLAPATVSRRPRDAAASARNGAVRIALPDGHQLKHAVAALDAAGLRFDGYGIDEYVARPRSELPGLEAKVVRPQDMPQQVALGHFDLAIAGRDWLFDHLCRFPGSPVMEAVDLGLGRYNVAAVVSEELPATSIDEAVALWQDEGKKTVRVASEYANIADDCARSHHLPRYKVIPIGGASEGFVPEDAELLIEGTDTGATLAANRLKTIEALLESTACVITSRRPVDERKQPLLDHVLRLLREA